MAVTQTEAWSPKWTFADRLRKARRQAGLSQEELAARLGIKTSRLSGWEAGANEPRRIVDVARTLEEIVGVDAQWLLGLRNDVSGWEFEPAGRLAVPA